MIRRAASCTLVTTKSAKFCRCRASFQRRGVFDEPLLLGGDAGLEIVHRARGEISGRPGSSVISRSPMYGHWP